MLALLVVASSAIMLMRQEVMRGFSDYAANIELDRLEELSDALQRQYGRHGNWDFLPAEAAARRSWIGAEMGRLQQQRVHQEQAGQGGAPTAPVPMPAPARTQNARTLPLQQERALPAPLPPVPAAPPIAPGAPVPAPARMEPPAAPPLPPLPPLPPPAASLASEPPSIAGREGMTEAIDTLPLQLRITLLDAKRGYLAGRRAATQADGAPQLERAIQAGGRTIAYLLVAKAATPSDALALAFLRQFKSTLLMIIAGSLVLSALAAMLLAAHFRRPIERLAAGARALSEGRFDTRLAAGRSDELGELARAFNALALKLATTEQARRQWVADTSHELRTPLSVLRAQLEAIEDGVRQADAATVASMLRQVLALNKLVDELYVLARADVGELDCQAGPVDLWQMLAQQAGGFADKAAAAGLSIELGAPPPSTVVWADPDRLRQVIGNLLENSVRYTERGGRLSLQASAGGGHLTLVFEDSAPGVPQAALARLGERFFRIDAARARAQGGAGLGLALCRRLIEAQHGSIAFAHAALGGLRVSLTLPLAP